MPLSVLPLEVPREGSTRGCCWNQKGLDSGPEQHQRESGFVDRKGDSRTSFSAGP